MAANKIPSYVVFIWNNLEKNPSPTTAVGHSYSVLWSRNRSEAFQRV